MTINWTTVFCSAAIIGAVTAVLPKAIKKFKEKKNDPDGLVLTPDEDSAELFQKFTDECSQEADIIVQAKDDVNKAVLSLEKGNSDLVMAVLFIKTLEGKVIKTNISCSRALHIKECPQTVIDAINADGYIIKKY